MCLTLGIDVIQLAESIECHDLIQHQRDAFPWEVEIRKLGWVHNGGPVVIDEPVWRREVNSLFPKSHLSRPQDVCNDPAIHLRTCSTSAHDMVSPGCHLLSAFQALEQCSHVRSGLCEPPAGIDGYAASLVDVFYEQP